ncbi:MAG: hypothetical protein JOZ90_06080 [Alphaproteobacteria bacterium]|nr:hypothetical protein [Alphaproteobacteria bacterium]MBV9372728.1 hypothetical protein [Alphaproteobacteria bacterium]MBV9900647.1 hypothetical protein [Alphaproteobacteria bacterium]
MPRPFNARQRLENEAFLVALGRSGNARMSAREAGVAYSTMQTRRNGHPDFASRWDIALVGAHARFHARGGRPDPARDARAAGGSRRRGAAPAALRTEGGELVVVRTRSGRLQVRPAHRGKLTPAAEQLFLQALAATANVRLSAAAVGASAGAFYRRVRQKPAFARERRLALEMGYDRLETAAIAAATPDSHADDAWRLNAAAPIPPMTTSQAIQLLYLHQKGVRLGWEQPHRRRRRGESEETYRARLQAMTAVEEAREREDSAVRRAVERGWDSPPPPLPALPALDQVTGWSGASGRPPRHPQVALFGGWRIADMEASRGEGGGGGRPGEATAPGRRLPCKSTGSAWKRG